MQNEKLFFHAVNLPSVQFKKIVRCAKQSIVRVALRDKNQRLSFS